MPSSKNYVRDYKQEQKTATARKEDKDRAKRNAARRAALKKGTVKKGDKKDIDHKRGIKAGNGKKNLRVQSASTNRSAGGRKGNKAGKAAGGRKSKR